MFQRKVAATISTTSKTECIKLVFGDTSMLFKHKFAAYTAMTKSNTRTPWTLTRYATPTSTATSQFSPCPWDGIHTLSPNPSGPPTTQRSQTNVAFQTSALALLAHSKHNTLSPSPLSLTDWHLLSPLVPLQQLFIP